MALAPSTVLVCFVKGKSMPAWALRRFCDPLGMDFCLLSEKVKIHLLLCYIQLSQHHSLEMALTPHCSTVPLAINPESACILDSALFSCLIWLSFLAMLYNFLDRNLTHLSSD